MLIGIPKEICDGEKRVACTPDQAIALSRLGHQVLLERNAGLAAGFSDTDYQKADVVVVKDALILWRRAGIICKVRPPAQHPDLSVHESTLVTRGKILISFFWPDQNQEMLRQIADQGGTVLAMDAVPRISRAQEMDALTSMANVSGYRAVIEASQHCGRFFTGQVTAAGRMAPVKVLVIGAGVAGLSAIGTASRLGAVVRAFDTRAQAQEQVESLGAEFLELDFAEDGSGEGGYAKVMSAAFIRAEMALFAKQAKEVDVIITTALVPGKPAPNLISAEMVTTMKRGSVIVDLAAEQGGNCECTEPGKVTRKGGVSIIGYTDLPSRMAMQSSQFYAANVRHLIAVLTPQKRGELFINMEDEVIYAVTVAHEGKVTWPPTAPPAPVASPLPKPVIVTPSAAPEQAPAKQGWATFAAAAVGLGAILSVGTATPPSFMNHFTVFVLACFVGWQVIWNVTPALHTPLMSVTNAISSIIIIGALLQTGASHWIGLTMAFLAILLASINIFGGFLVTWRMLKMFTKQG